MLAAIAVAALAAAMTSLYVVDRIGLGMLPIAGVSSALAAAAMIWAALRRCVDDRLADTAAFVLVVSTCFGYLLWLAWPALLPLGSGSDLTHQSAISGSTSMASWISDSCQPR